MVWMRNFLKNQKGLSLIEVLAGLTILAVALIPIMMMFSTGLTGTVKTTYRNSALNLAQKKMEEIRNKTWTNATDEIPLGSSTVEVTIGGRKFDLKTEIEKAFIRGELRDDIRKITVTVSWTIGGDTKSLSLVTYRLRGI